MTKSPKTKKGSKKPKREFKNKKELETQAEERGVGSNKHSSADNDWTWYANNEYLLRDSASLAYSNPAGVPFNWRNAKMGVSGSNYSFPGIITLEVAPTIGGALNPSDAVNVAARNIYSYVRHANSGHANYDAPNLMLYLLAMDSLYSAYSWLTRAYGLIRTFSQKNRYIPEPLFAAMGLDYNDFLYNQVQFRFWLNTVAERIGSLCVPASMTYMMRHMWMFQNVFVDNMGLKAQMYVYNPAYFVKYVPVAEGIDAPALENTLQVNPPSVKLTFEAVSAAVNEMIDCVMRQEDLNIMSGDILKAFGEGSVWKLVPIHEDYDITAVYSDEVLHQIHNATCCNQSWFASTGARRYKFYEHIDAATAVSWIKQTEMPGDSLSPLGWILDVHTDTPDPALTMVATRLMHGCGDWELQNPGLTSQNVTICGSEVCTRMFVTSAALAAPFGPVTELLSTTVQQGSNTDTLIAQMKNAAKLANFSMHPSMYVYKISQVSTQPVRYGVQVAEVISDIDNYTLITNEELIKMHETALLSEFNVPLMGSWAHKLY